jgi:hypothetical protein
MRLRLTAARGLALAAAVAVTVSLNSGGRAVADIEAPSWSDVQDARQNEAAAAAVTAALEEALDEAEASAVTLSATALEKAATAESARAEAAAAAARAAELADRSAEAEAELAERRGQLGALASGLYRTQSDGALVARLLTSAEPDSLLRRLGLLDRLSSTWAGLVSESQRSAGATESLRAQAETARVAREDAARTASDAASSAQAAADAEHARVAAVQAQVSTLYAQLATLKNTTADAERSYRLGQQVAREPTTGAGGAGSGGAGTAGAGGSGGAGAGGSGAAPTGVTVDPAGAKAYARTAVGRYGWGDDQYQCLVLLWNRESGWRADALNRSSGAYGIPQALPATRMAAAGADWRTNGNTQVEWGLLYVKSRYGSPCSAWSHSQSTGWY